MKIPHLVQHSEMPGCVSSLVNLVAPLNLSKLSSVDGTGWYSCLITLLRSFGSREILNLPSGFSLTSEFTNWLDLLLV